MAAVLAMGMKPGKAVGELLRHLEDEQLEGTLKDREHALHRARELHRAKTGEG